MSYGDCALQGRVPVDFRLAWLRPAGRIIAEGARWLGSGVLFAATVYIVMAVPGLID